MAVLIHNFIQCFFSSFLLIPVIVRVSERVLKNIEMWISSCLCES